MVLADVIIILLGFAAWRDFATRNIPDVVSLALLLVGIGVRLEDGGSALAISAAVAAALFLFLMPFHWLGLVGGGDLKLLAALSFGLSPLASYQMISAVVMSGGVLALIYLALRHLVVRSAAGRGAALDRRSVLHRVLAIELWRIRKRAPLPYAIAIAAGAALVMRHQGA